MDFYYRGLQAPIFKKKEYKKQSQKSYWKKFKPFISEQYPSAVSNIKFARNLLAMTSKTMLKVYDINNYKSRSSDQEEEEEDQEDFNLFISKPQSFKTKEVISALQFRQDRNYYFANAYHNFLEKIVLIGDTQGKISLIPRQTSFRPLSVFNSKSKVTSIQFNSHEITQFTCANSINEIQIWQLSDYRKAKFTIRKAHQDLIKDITYQKDCQSVLYSLSYDRTMRRWDTRQKINTQSSVIIKNDQPFETLCFIPTQGDSNQFLTGSGRSVKLWDLRKLDQDCIMNKQVHSKTISKLAYFKQKSRVLSASHDGNLRVLAINEDTTISSIYGIKYGSEILSMDASDDDAFAVGAYNGGLWSLQKRQRGQQLQDGEEEKFEFKRIQRVRQNTGKSRQYFNRGAYDKFSDAKHDDNSGLQIIAPKSQKKDKITKYLKKFEYKLALDCCSSSTSQRQQNIIKIITLVKELQLRNALDISLKDRTNHQILSLLQMINWKIMDDRYTETMCTLLNRILLLYAYSLPYDKAVWNEVLLIIQKSQKFADVATKLIEVKGQIDSLLFIIQNIKTQ